MIRLTCPVCEQGALTLETFADDFKHGAGTVRVSDLECCRCDHCGADPVLADQIARNHQRVASARRSVCAHPGFELGTHKDSPK